MNHLQPTQRQAGFGHVLLVLALVVFGAIGAIGYAVYSQQSDAKDTAVLAPASDAAVQTTELSAPQIKSEADLDTATETLDKVDPSTANQADEARLDDQLDDF